MAGEAETSEVYGPHNPPKSVPSARVGVERERGMEGGRKRKVLAKSYPAGRHWVPLTLETRVPGGREGVGYREREGREGVGYEITPGLALVCVVCNCFSSPYV